MTALDAGGIPLLPVDHSAARSKEEYRLATVDGSEARFDLNLTCLNPAQYWQLLRDRPETCVAGRHTIGFWWWEIADVLAVEWRVGFGLVDEVWVASDHAATAIRRCAPVPVVKVGIPVQPQPGPGLSRSDLGLPEGFLFLTVIDYDSGVERKNPLAAIRAFASAFEPGGGAALVVKSINGERHPADRARLEREAAGHPDIHLIDRYATRAEKDALIAACDCYVSLHRAEGFGLPLAEAMYLARPTIATAYSGNLEFMTPANSYLVDYRLSAVGPDAGAAYYPAAGEWADPDLDHAARLMRAAFDRPSDARLRARRAAADIRRSFSPRATARTMTARLEEIWGGAPDRPASPEGRRLLQRAAELAALRGRA
jgi:glycosyltransferase involved in cell wall biosynthesis